MGAYTSGSTNFCTSKKGFMRVMCGMGYKDCVRHKFGELFLLFHLCIFIRRWCMCIRIQILRYCGCWPPTYATRSVGQLKTQCLRLSTSRNGINYHGPRFFNMHPNTGKRQPLTKFKQVIKRFLIQQTFYWVDNLSLSGVWCVCFVCSYIIHVLYLLYYDIFFLSWCYVCTLLIAL